MFVMLTNNGLDLSEKVESEKWNETRVESGMKRVWSLKVFGK